MSLKYKLSVFFIVLIFLILSVVTFTLIQTRSREIQNELTIRNTFLAQKIVPDIINDIGDYYYYLYPTYVEFVNKRLSTYPDILRFKIYNLDSQELFDTATMHESYTAPETPRKTDDPAVLKVFENKLVTADVVPYNGQQTIRIIIPYVDRYDTFRNVIEFYFSTREVRAAVRKVIIFSTLMLLFGTGLAVVFTFLLVNQITAPIIHLTKAAENISKGNLDVTIDTKSDDEIGRLSNTFKQMAAEVKKSRMELEQYSKNLEDQVQKRTKELQDRIEEMKRLENLTVDRELKMVELKKEIESLKAGQPQKNPA